MTTWTSGGRLRPRRLATAAAAAAPDVGVARPAVAGRAAARAGSSTTTTTTTQKQRRPLRIPDGAPADLVLLLNFLETATDDWEDGTVVRRCELFGETVACVQWQGRFFVTGTDVVRTLVWRFRLMGLPVADRKKFEEGVFSDLRNLKPGVGSVLEEPHSRFLDLLYKLNCIRTQKKQKVFFWAAVPHERLYREALRREQRRGVVPFDSPAAIDDATDSTQEDSRTEAVAHETDDPTSGDEHPHDLDAAESGSGSESGSDSDGPYSPRPTNVMELLLTAAAIADALHRRGHTSDADGDGDDDRVDDRDDDYGSMSEDDAHHDAHERWHTTTPPPSARRPLYARFIRPLC